MLGTLTFNGGINLLLSWLLLVLVYLIVILFHIAIYITCLFLFSFLIMLYSLFYSVHITVSDIILNSNIYIYYFFSSDILVAEIYLTKASVQLDIRATMLRKL